MPIQGRRRTQVWLLAVVAATAGEASAQVRTASGVPAPPPTRPTRIVETTTLSLPGARVEVVVEEFLLRAPTYRSVRAQLATDGPLTGTGLRANAVTGYEIRPRVPVVSDGERCRTRNVHVEAEIRILLPQWESHELAPTGERNRWLTFRDALVRHENAHRDSTLVAVEAIRDELERLSAGNCPRLVRRVNRVMERAWASLDRAHAAIDRSENHALPVR